MRPMPKNGPIKKSNEEPHPISVVSPWYHAGMDLVKMPVSKSGNNYLLTVMDYFTKWSHAVPIPDESARTVVSELYNTSMVMGFPAIYSSDQGREFVNDVISCMMEKIKAAHRISSAYHPQTNGLVERFNKTTR